MVVSTQLRGGASLHSINDNYIQRDAKWKQDKGDVKRLMQE